MGRMGSFMLALQHRPALIRGALAVLVPVACPRGLLIPRDRIPMPYARCPFLSFEASCAIDVPPRRGVPCRLGPCT
jgi:hypothetical protein